MREPPQPLERKLDLSGAPRERDAQGGLRSPAEDPVVVKAVADLKSFHSFHERPFVCCRPCGSRRSRGQIAERNELAVEDAKSRVRLPWVHNGGKRRSRFQCRVGGE